MAIDANRRVEHIMSGLGLIAFGVDQMSSRQLEASAIGQYLESRRVVCPATVMLLVQKPGVIAFLLPGSLT